jgi:hypothetical protein
MPFGLLVGMNNHFQSIIFGGIMMRDEKKESFDWFFKTMCVATRQNHGRCHYRLPNIVS